MDFNTLMRDRAVGGQVRINERDYAPDFADGMRVLIHDETLEVEATLEFDPVYRGSRASPDHPTNDWWARPDWSTRRDLPWPRGSAG